MAKVTVNKSKKTAAPPPPAEDLDDLGAEDLGGEDDDILGDIDDLGGVAEVDDLGVSVEDVEAAMQSITPTQEGISDAALAALSGEVAKISKAFESMQKAAKSEAVLQAVDKMGEALAAMGKGISALTDAVDKNHAFVADAVKTLVNLLGSGAPSAKPKVADKPTHAVEPQADFSALDGWLKAQFEGLGSGKVYPIEKVAEVFAKREGNHDAATIATRMKVVFADLFKKAGRDGFFTK